MINEIMKIKSNFGNDAYVGISGDRFLDGVSINLRNLWYSPEQMSLVNINIYYNRIFDMCYPTYSQDIFKSELKKLNDALANEFALIIKSKSKQKGVKCDEGIKSVFKF